MEAVGLKLVGFLAPALVGGFRLIIFLFKGSLVMVKAGFKKGVGVWREVDGIFMGAACIELS